MTRPLIFLLWFAFLVVSCNNKKHNPDYQPVEKTIQTGAILDLSGQYSEAGLTGKAAIELAIEDVNRRYASIGSPVRLVCTYLDTHLDTALTLQAAMGMYNQGIRLLVAGPNNSACLKAIHPFLQEKQMLALTCFSSSPSLAIPGDYTFRLITDDNVQARALVKMMRYDSIRALIPVWREDTYGTGLEQTIRQKFTAEGYLVMDGASYKPDVNDFQQLIDQASLQAEEAVATFGAARVGIVLISYQEAAGILGIASHNNTLNLVRWYGCDANVQKTAISDDPVAGPFAHAVRFLAPIMGIGTAGQLPPNARALSDKIFQRTGLLPDAYALTAYDALRITALACDIAGSADASLVKPIIPSVCESYNYLGIQRTLNEAGDLATANYIFWTVIPSRTGYHWDSYATYMAEGDYILIR